MKAYCCGLGKFHAVGPAGGGRGEGNDHVMVPYAEGFRDIQCGSTFSLFLSDDGKIDLVGMLNGLLYPSPQPVPVQLPMPVLQMSCGKKHALLLLDGGFVLSFGTGFFGQLGHGNDYCLNTPKLVEALHPRQLGTQAQVVAAGGNHSAVLTKSGKVFLFGLNRSSQCGVSARCDSVLIPTLLESSEKESGYTWGTSNGGGKIVDVICGKSHSAFLTADGNVFSWGGSTYGRLGVQRALPKIQHYPVMVRYFLDNHIQVAKLVSGDYHMLALTKSGSVYSWGYGADGQLGQSSLYHFRSPKQIDHFEDHGASIVDIECGGLYSAAVDDMGRLWTWGYGDGGWLGTHRSEDGEPPNFETEDPTEFPFIEGHEIVSTFMSQMCVIVPKKVAQLVGRVSVRMVRCGDSHCVAIAD